MPYLTIGKNRGEFQVYFETHGNGSEKVVLIMGFLTPGDEWHRQIDFLKQYEDYEVCVYDNRGVGKSGEPKGNYSSTDMAKDIIEIVDHLGWEKVHIIGASMGGMVAIELCLMLLNRTKTLLLAVTHAGSAPPLTGMLAISRSIITMDPRKRGEIILPVLYSAKYLASYSQTEPDKLNKEVLLDKFVEKEKTQKPVGLYGVVGHIKTVLTHSVSKERLIQIRDANIPISILTGTDDHLVKTKNSHYLNDILKPSEFLVIDGAGHVINVENQDQFNEAILRNLKRGSN